MLCPTCGNENRPGARSCARCGTLLLQASPFPQPPITAVPAQPQPLAPIIRAPPRHRLRRARLDPHMSALPAVGRRANSVRGKHIRPSAAARHLAQGVQGASVGVGCDVWHSGSPGAWSDRGNTSARRRGQHRAVWPGRNDKEIFGAAGPRAGRDWPRPRTLHWARGVGACRCLAGRCAVVDWPLPESLPPTAALPLAEGPGQVEPLILLLQPACWRLSPRSESPDTAETDAPLPLRDRDRIAAILWSIAMYSWPDGGARQHRDRVGGRAGGSTARGLDRPAFVMAPLRLPGDSSRYKTGLEARLQQGKPR